MSDHEEPLLFEEDELEAKKPRAKKKAAKKKAAKKKAVKKAAAKKKATAKKKAPAKKKAVKKKVAVKKKAPAKKKAAKKKAAKKKTAIKAEIDVEETIEEPDKETSTVVEEEKIAAVEKSEPDHGSDSSESKGRRDDSRPRGRNRFKGKPHRNNGANGDRPQNGDRPPRGGRHQKFRKEVQLGPPEQGSGVVELSPKGFGFLRKPEKAFYQTNKDTFVSPEMVRTFGLRDGHILEGEVRRGPRGPQMTRIDTINGEDPSVYSDLPVFEELTAINPNKRLILETQADRHTTRVVDMMTPVGRGQRGLIVAPPRTGKTTLLQHIAEAVSHNYDQIHIILLLIDERPEEVTEFKRALPNVEIMASSNDSDARSHMRVAQLTIERAKRLVEAGKDVFILLDSITRLGRAFNNSIRGKGKTMSGGIDARALEIPRKLFAAARNTREAGSLTVLATALIDTGSRMDELIFQEFKGTGNMELVLDRTIAEQYIFPAVDIFKSGTRREELLLPPHQLEKIYTIRRGLAGHKPVEAIERLLSFVRRVPNNPQLLMEIKAAAPE